MPSNQKETEVVATFVLLVRRALQRRDVEEARKTFLRLPAPDRLREKCLEDILRDLYAAGLIDVKDAISFIERLPNQALTLAGCCVLHRVNLSLESVDTHVALARSLPLADCLFKLMDCLDGSLKVRAESYWYEWVSPMVRAIVKGSPLVIESCLWHEVLYAAGDMFAIDKERRSVFSWRKTWIPDERKEQWHLEPRGENRDRFRLKNLRYGEYMCAANRRFPDGRARVFTWVGDPGDAGDWQFELLDPQSRDVFTLYNRHKNQHLSSPNDIYDFERRHVVTSAASPSSTAWMEEHKWRISPLEYTAMEKGIEALFTKRYEEAVQLLTAAIGQPDNADHVKCYAYRMIANLRLGNAEHSKSDFAKIEGAAKQDITDGLRHLWSDNMSIFATSLGVIFPDQIKSIELKFDDSCASLQEGAVEKPKSVANDTEFEVTHEDKVQYKERTTIVVKADDDAVVPEGWNGFVRLRPQRSDSVFAGFISAQRIATGAENVVEINQMHKTIFKVPPRAVAVLKHRDEHKSVSAVCSGQWVVTTSSGVKTLPFRGTFSMNKTTCQVPYCQAEAPQQP